MPAIDGRPAARAAFPLAFALFSPPPALPMRRGHPNQPPLDPCALPLLQRTCIAIATPMEVQPMPFTHAPATPALPTRSPGDVSTVRLRPGKTA
jgi:hypothetical protein